MRAIMDETLDETLFGALRYQEGRPKPASGNQPGASGSATSRPAAGRWQTGPSSPARWRRDMRRCWTSAASCRSLRTRPNK
jgi:hypothetical protein